MPEDVLPCGHLESELCGGDETVLLDHRVNRLHPAVPEVYPGEREDIRRGVCLGEDVSMRMNYGC